MLTAKNLYLFLRSPRDIRAAIEWPANIGNVTVSFPNFENDNISTACHTHVNGSAGGFVVRFDTEFGDLPIFETDPELNITVTEVLKGNSVSDCTSALCDPLV